MKIRNNILFLLLGLALSAFSVACVIPACEASSEIEKTIALEPYSIRPDILDIQRQMLQAGDRRAYSSELDAEILGDFDDLEGILKAHAVILPQILEMHPLHMIFFLGRDTETLYDLGRLITLQGASQASGDAAAKSLHDHHRLGLVNISRKNMDHEDLWDYLEETRDRINQVRAQNQLRPLTQMLFVDSGVMGSVIDAIREKCPPIERENIDGYLYLSLQVERYAYSRTFWTVFHSNAATAPSSRFHDDLTLNIENLPHYTRRATGFQRINGRLDAVAPAINDQEVIEPPPADYDDSPEMDEILYNNMEDANANRASALALMQVTVRYAASAEARTLFQEHASLWKALNYHYTNSDGQFADALERELFRLLDSGNPYAKAVYRDFVDIVEKNYPHDLGRIKQIIDMGEEVLGPSSKAKKRKHVTSQKSSKGS